MKPTDLPFKNIWLADDDEDDRLVFADALNEVAPALQLTTFEGGDELLSALQQSTPDLLFLDINMPCINGKECLKLIKDNPAFSSLRVVMYSGSDYYPDIDTSYNTGAILYIVKPRTFQSLISVLRKIMQLNWSNAGNITLNQQVDDRFVPFNIDE